MSCQFTEKILIKYVWMIKKREPWFWNKPENVPISIVRRRENVFYNLGYEMIVTDPYFIDYDPSRSWILKEGKIGPYTIYAKYKTKTKFFPERIAELEIINFKKDEEVNKLATAYFDRILLYNRTCIAKNIVSKSGIIGIFNYNSYKKHNTDKSFLYKCKDLIKYDTDYSTVEEFGVVCWAGYGPGNYKLHVIKYCGRYIYICLEFLDIFNQKFVERTFRSSNENRRFSEEHLRLIRLNLKEYDLQQKYLDENKQYD